MLQRLLKEQEEEKENTKSSRLKKEKRSFSFQNHVADMLTAGNQTPASSLIGGGEDELLL